MQPAVTQEGTTAVAAAQRAARTAAIICLGAAVVVLVGASIVSQPLAGVALGLGFLLAALNAVVARRLLRLGALFAATSLLRLLVLTAIALATGPILGWPRVFLVAAGIAAGEIVLSGANAREVLRHR